MFQECYKKVSRVLTGVLGGVQGCLNAVQWVFKGSMKGVSRMLRGKFKSVSRKIEGCS